MSRSSSKQRPRWGDLSSSQRRTIEEVVGSAVVRADNCPGGFSPGFASRLMLADSRQVFVKAMDLGTWPDEGDTYRREILIAGALPPVVPAPRLLASAQTDAFVVLAFEALDGVQPRQPWDRRELDRVCDVLDGLTTIEAPEALLTQEDHPRLGGWAKIATDDLALAGLATRFPWASARIDDLVAWEQRGRDAAKGRSLTHFDLYAHNLLLTPSGTFVVDWPHARPAAAFVDTVMLLSTAHDGNDSERRWQQRAVRDLADPDDVTAVLVAHAGFCAAGAVWPPTRGLEAITAAKAELARGALGWLTRRWTV
jgi:Phosphotransferase enzyme family